MSRAPLFTFAFTPDNGYHFNTPDGGWMVKTPHAFKDAVSQNYKSMFDLSFGPGVNEYCAFWESTDNELRYSINFPSSAGLKYLENYFRDEFKNRPTASQDIQLTKLVIGPGCAHIAITPHEVRWADPNDSMPEELKELLRTQDLDQQQAEQRRRSFRDRMRGAHAPTAEAGRIVRAALGFSGAWWVQFENGEAQWDVKKDFPALDELLRSGQVPMEKMTSLVLSPFRATHFFLTYDTDKVHYSLPKSFADKVGEFMEKYYSSQETVVGSFGVPPSRAVGTGEDVKPPPYEA